MKKIGPETCTQPCVKHIQALKEGERERERERDERGTFFTIQRPSFICANFDCISIFSSHLNIKFPSNMIQSTLSVEVITIYTQP